MSIMHTLFLLLVGTLGFALGLVAIAALLGALSFLAAAITGSEGEP